MQIGAGSVRLFSKRNLNRVSNLVKNMRKRAFLVAFSIAFRISFESVYAAISVVMDVQRTTLGLDAEKRPLPCRAHTEQAAGF